MFTVDCEQGKELQEMTIAYICDAIRTPIGRYGGALSSVRTDDLAALPIKQLVERNPTVDWSALDDVVYGCANQSGEDNRNVARMALLLAGLPKEVSGSTVNRLCGSSLDALSVASRAIKAGDGVDSMPETAENVAEEFHVTRADQDAFAWRSQQRWAHAHATCFFTSEI